MEELRTTTEQQTAQDLLNQQLHDVSLSQTKDSFTSVDIQNKKQIFNNRVKITPFSAIPATCELGEIGEYSGGFYQCTATDTWTKIGPTTSLTSATITDSTITGGTVDSFLVGDGLSAVRLTASDTLQHSNDDTSDENNDSYSIQKSTLVYRGGTIRVKFDLAHINAGDGKAKIYVDGVAVGTERTSTGTSYVTFSEDILIKPFSYVQIYSFHGSGNAAEKASVKNFRIYYTPVQNSTNAELIQATR